MPIDGYQSNTTTPAKRHLRHPTRRDALLRPVSYCCLTTRPDLLTTNAAEMTCAVCRSALYGRRREMEATR